MSPRPYRLGRREAAVADTRERILAAARDVLGENGFAGFTIDAVADRAGVARMTVYYQFDSKGALLDALLDALAAGKPRRPPARARRARRTRSTRPGLEPLDAPRAKSSSPPLSGSGRATAS